MLIKENINSAPSKERGIKLDDEWRVCQKYKF